MVEMLKMLRRVSNGDRTLTSEHGSGCKIKAAAVAGTKHTFHFVHERCG